MKKAKKNRDHAGKIEQFEYSFISRCACGWSRKHRYRFRVLELLIEHFRLENTMLQILPDMKNWNGFGEQKQRNSDYLLHSNTKTGE